VGLGLCFISWCDYVLSAGVSWFYLLVYVLSVGVSMFYLLV